MWGHQGFHLKTIIMGGINLLGKYKKQCNELYINWLLVYKMQRPLAYNNLNRKVPGIANASHHKYFQSIWNTLTICSLTQAYSPVTVALDYICTNSKNKNKGEMK